jgi:glycosidase
MAVQRLADVDFAALRGRDFFPSPPAWEDQVLYFFLVDRFSDGHEDGYRDNTGDVVAGEATPPFTPADRENAVRSEDDAAHWRAAGASWVGGTLRGAQSKIGYLRRLGVTAIWVSPVLKQARSASSYHGYAIQDFLAVDPHFGTAEDLRDLVRTAHEHGLYVILDVILNHTGDVFGYEADRYWTQDNTSGQWFLDPRWDGAPYAVHGFRDANGAPTLPFRAGPLPEAWPDGAIWPAELQAPDTFTRKGRIAGWDHDPEFREGDFFGLKDVAQGEGGPGDYRPSAALLDLTRVYQYWVAYADLDGLRVDTVKHMDLGASRFFASAMHEFAQTLGKDRFYLIGEITGGRRRAYETLEVTGLDAALGIDDVQDKLEWTVKGRADPDEYFRLFRNSLLVQKDSHVWFRDKVVTSYDDHDQVRKGQGKARFCADADGSPLALAVLALNATTLGIPCIYYGSEQRFDGSGGDDRYIREAMFGGAFGAFRSRGRHFFDETGPVFQELAAVLELRRQLMPLRRGRQYLREISGDGDHFGLPQVVGGRLRSVVAWSRILADEEVLLAINTDSDVSTTAWVTVDAGLHADGSALECRYSSDRAQIGGQLPVAPRNGRAVLLTVPPAGFVIYR